MGSLNFDPKTRRPVISDLTPPIRGRLATLTTSVANHTATLAEQEELNFITSQVVRSILFSLWQGVDWDSADLSDIDWSEWIEPVLRSGEASDPFDWNNQGIFNIKKINYTDPTELTISSGSITVTQSRHTVDTEGDAAEDFLDTINGGTEGDDLILTPAHTDRTTTLRHGVGNIYLAPEDVIGVFGFNSPAGSSGIFYAAGFYRAPAADANLNQGSLTVSYGTANIAYAAHAFIVTKQAGTCDTGTVSIVVSGTSITDDGTRSAADSETILADITAATANGYYETDKKWIGTIVFTLTETVPNPAAYASDFNYGYAKYHDFNNQHFHLTSIDCVGRAGANDTGFNIRLLHHCPDDWTYSAAAFVPGAAVGSACELANMNTDYVTETDLANGLPFAYKRTNLSEEIDGNTTEGILVEITTSANKSVDRMDILLKAHSAPRLAPLDGTEESIRLIYKSSKWCQV